MKGASLELKAEFAESLSSAIKSLHPKAEISAEQLLNSIKHEKNDYDMSSSVSFVLAKQTKKNPVEIAMGIAGKIGKAKMLDKVEAKSGYINAKIDVEAYSRLVIDEVNKKKISYGRGSSGTGKKVIVESPSINPNKPWHIGHLRNAMLGDVISNIISACSYSVERENYIDDLGLQVAETLWGYMNIGDKPDGKFDQWLGEQYVLVNKRMAEDKKIVEQINVLIKKMEEKGTKENELARRISERCVMAQYETSFNYNICHDVLVWESDIVRERLLDKAMSIAESKKAIEKPKDGKYAGCVTINLEKAKEIAKDFDNPIEDTKVLIRSNGTATYVAKDLAFHMWKFGLIEDTFKYKAFIENQPNKKMLYTTSSSGSRESFAHADIVVNIIGDKQRYPQLILKAAFELMGYKKISDNIIHLSYGDVSVASGSLSGRKGGWMGTDGRSYTADSLLEEVTKAAASIVSESKKITEKSKTDEIAKAIAISAIKFDFLRISPEKRVIFSWDNALKFEGDTGPYCMYTYARATRILEKANYSGSKPADSSYKLIGNHEFALIKTISMAEEAIEKARNEYRPNVITDYLIELCTAFSKFYESVPVINSGEAEAVRLSIVHAARQAIGNMLLVLGISPVERM